MQFDFLYDTNLASRGKQIHQNVVENVNEFVRSEINEDKRPAVYDPRGRYVILIKLWELKNIFI